MTKPGTRQQELKRILEGQRDRILNSVRATLREGRVEGAVADSDVHDEAEVSEADVQNELAVAFLQMRAETLEHITEALDRLDAGDYGFCADCGGPIAATRLHALPFATRCKRCAEDHETTHLQHAPIWSVREGFGSST
jgi:DnaK suppressor protein